VTNDTLHADIAATRRRWLVTGAAGFIGSHLVETLLRLGQEVVGLDNLSTGSLTNLEEVRAAVGEDAWRCHRFIQGDIVEPGICARACIDVDVVLHHAALGSVPRSIEEPLRTHAANATGFVNMLVAARDLGVGRRALEVGSHHPLANRAVPNVGRHVDRGGL